MWVWIATHYVIELLCNWTGEPKNLDVENTFNLVAIFAQSRVRSTQAGVIVADGHNISVLSYAQGEFVILDMHKHSENVNLLHW